MEKIIGINEVRPKLSFIIESLDKPVIITVNSEPKSVLMRYDEYLRLSNAESEIKRLSLQLAVEKARSQSKDAGITEANIAEEIAEYRKSKRGNNQ